MNVYVEPKDAGKKAPEDRYAGRPSSRRTSSQRIWEPSHGIVFSPPGAGAEFTSANTTDHSALVQESARPMTGRESSAMSASALLVLSNKRVYPETPAPSLLRSRTHSTKADRGSTTQTNVTNQAEKVEGRALDLQSKANSLVESLRQSLASFAVNRQDGARSTSGDAAAEDEETADAKLPQEFWTYEHHGKTTGQTPEIRTCDTYAAADEATALLLDEDVLGLDIEWVANASWDRDPKRRVSLLQIAGKDLIVLVQIARFAGSEAKDLMPPNLKTLLESPDIKKAGVNIRQDCSRIRESLEVGTDGIYELSHLFKLVKYSPEGEAGRKQINKRLVALSTQVEEHLGLPLFKEQDVRSSDWTKPLSAEQTLYAGSDAYAGYVLYQTMDEKRLALDPVPPSPPALDCTNASAQKDGRPRPKVAAAARNGVPIDDGNGNGDKAEDEGEDAEVEVPNAAEAESDMLLPDDAASPAPVDPSRETETDKSALFTAATAFAHQHRAAVLAVRGSSAPRPGVAHLRAYYLWHAEDLDVPDVARTLGIKPGSAAGYVLEAMMVGKLPGDIVRVAVVAKYVPANVLRLRYAGFLRRLLEE